MWGRGERMPLSHLLWANGGGREREGEKMNMKIFGPNKKNLGKENMEAVDGWNLRILKDNQGRVQQGRIHGRINLVPVTGGTEGLTQRSEKDGS